MSVRNGLLALLARQTSHGYELRNAYEAHTGANSLNVGQVYTTLHRLERDGLVEPLDGDGTGGSAGGGDAGRTPYRVTDAGRAALHHWFATPIGSDDPGREELVVKINLAITTPGIDVVAVIATQRAATLTALQRLTAAKARLDPGDLVALVNADFAIARADGELAWLDLVEQRVRRHHHSTAHDQGAPA